ncbi:MAG: hypothetical protein RLZZ428_677 [Pseudomonadota bacterium]|jgi:hypothetical protein
MITKSDVLRLAEYCISKNGLSDEDAKLIEEHLENAAFDGDVKNTPINLMDIVSEIQNDTGDWDDDEADRISMVCDLMIDELESVIEKEDDLDDYEDDDDGFEDFREDDYEDDEYAEEEE